MIYKFFPLLMLATAAAADTGSCQAGAVQVKRESGEPDFCIACPRTGLGDGTPKIALCTPRTSSNVETITSSNDIIVSGVGGETIIVGNRRLMAVDTIQGVTVDDVICDGDRVEPVGIKCFYGNDYARNFDPNITDTTGKEYTAEYLNSQIDLPQSSAIMLNNIFLMCLVYLLCIW
jgi:hypothetical protein